MDRLIAGLYRVRAEWNGGFRRREDWRACKVTWERDNARKGE